MLDFGWQATTAVTALAKIKATTASSSYVSNDALAMENDNDNWSNWSSYAPAMLYNAMSSALAVANQTPLLDYNQGLQHSYNLSGSSGSDSGGGSTSLGVAGNLSNFLPTTGLAADADEAADGSDDVAAASFAFVLPWWRQVLWSLLFVGMVIVATGGNLIVVWIVLTTKRMRTVTNYFIVNLSIADVMVSSLNVTFNYYYMLDNDWPFGEFYCKVSQFIAMLSICASVFTLMAISIDRYVAIMKPLQPRMSKRRNLAIAAAIWLASTLISCPMLLFYRTEEVLLQNSSRIVCFPEWPDGATNHSKQEYFYNIIIMILTYFLPIISMTVTYSRVGIELWGSQTIGEYTPRQVENVRSKRRVVKMMIVVVLIFGVCWLPFHTYFIVTSCYPAITEAPFIQELYLVIYWLAMSNSMYNPIIYCWMNSRFRFGFKLFFRWCPFVHIGAESLNRRDNLTSRYSCSGSPDHNRIKRNDTQKSILYTCPSSPKTHRVSHTGILRNAKHEVLQRHSAPLESSNRCSVAAHKAAYQQEMQGLGTAKQQRRSVNTPGNNGLSLHVPATDSRITQMLS